MQSLGADDPRTVGDYALLGRLGRGAMGTVFLGESPGGRPVAVKVARTELADDPEFRERFRREVEMARSVGGFWTAAVVDADPDAPRPWLATEYVAGPTLQRAVAAHGPLPQDVVARLAAGLAEALVAIHGAGLVHRDLKPSNVLLGADGPRVIDFGISRAMRNSALTATGQFFGTPGFLSPEQIAGEEVGQSSDVFSLGAVLVFAATGRGPFGDGPSTALVYRAVHGEPELDGVPEPLREVITACLARDPAQRPAPEQVLTTVGQKHPAPPDQWLPVPVRTLVEQHHTELDDRVRRTPEPAVVDGGGATTTAEKPPAKAGPKPGTRQYTALPKQHPAAGGPASTPRSPARGGGASFRTPRHAALLRGSAYLALALFGASIADPASGAPGLLRLAGLVAFLLFGLRSVRLLYHGARPQLTLEIGTEGITVARGPQQRTLPWSTITRVRVVGDRRKPTVVVWLADSSAAPGSVGRGTFRADHGGLRVFPIAHERWRSRRDQEVRELRAALAWHGRQVYDPSP